MSKTNTNIGFSIMMLIAVFLLILLISKTVGSVLSGSHTVDMSDEAIAARIAPVGQVNTDASAAAAAAAPVVEATAAAGPVDGKQVYDGTCFGCHGTGAAGAPKFGDQAAWADRIAKGMDTLTQHALNGFNVMPPRGGNPSLSDEAVVAAIEYMTSHSK